jgi:hypothetical protein
MVREIRPGAQVEGQTLAAASAERLTAAGRLDEPEGVLVMTLARAIDDGGHSGSALAVLSREFARALAVAAGEGRRASGAGEVDWDVG